MIIWLFFLNFDLKTEKIDFFINVALKTEQFRTINTNFCWLFDYFFKMLTSKLKNVDKKLTFYEKNVIVFYLITIENQ